MNRFRVSILVLTLLAGFAACEAQEGQGRRGGRGQGNFDPAAMAERQVSRISEALELSEEQTKETTELYEKFGKKQAELREEFSDNREGMRGKMQELNKEREAEFKKILTEDQWKKWEEVREEFQRRRGPRQN